MDKKLEQLIKENKINQLSDKKLQPLAQRLELLEKAGYTSLASQIRQEVPAELYQQTGNRLILKTPKFERKYEQELNPPLTHKLGKPATIIGGLILLTLFILAPISEPQAVLGTTLSFTCFLIGFASWMSSDTTWNSNSYQVYDLHNGKYLVESQINEYRGHVPDQILQETIRIKKDGLKPAIWFVSTPKEIPNITYGQIIDPLLVGYPKHRSDYAILYGIWGEDIEDLTKIT
jgi:hypothetical protein